MYFKHLQSRMELHEKVRKARYGMTYHANHIYLAKMQPHSPTLGVIAREMALDVAGLSYAPDIVRHIPGIANVSADALSRRYEPFSKV